MAARAHSREYGRDTLIAGGIAALLSAVWVIRDWANLVARHLPDTDDAVRLQQIRDWLGGQAFADLSQHRLAGGLAMHWSRLPDLVPGTIIEALTPLVGTPTAELVTIIAWPALLFAAALMLIGRIARSVDAGIAPAAIIVAAIGYPVTTLFLPGRIDHHGLQIVLLLVIVRALLMTPSRASGAIAGVATVASLITGMEMAPFLALAASWLWLDWLRGRDGATATLASFGGATIAALTIGGSIFASRQFDYPGCDGFTRTVWQLALAGSAGAAMLAIAGRWLKSWKGRLAATAAIAGLCAFASLPGLHACLRPYGSVDPLVARLWLDHVGEAQSLLAAPWPTALGYAGLLIAGLIAGCWRLIGTRARGWALLVVFQIASLLLALIEVRGVYAGAMLGAPALAAAIGIARQRGVLALAGAWIGSAGMVYPIAAQALAARPAENHERPVAGDIGCNDHAAMDRLRRLPAGTLMAPIDAGSYALAETRHRVIAAPYHRNNAGNAAMYRFFLADDATARIIAVRWRVDYVMLCDPAPPGVLAHQLRSGKSPAWLRPVGQDLWRVR